MGRIVAFLGLLLCCITFSADASIVAAPPTGGLSSFPLPVGSGVVVAAYGLRRLIPSYTSLSQFVNVERASDSTTHDIGTVDGYNFDVGTFNTFCAATTCYVKIWYDQSGNGANVTQSTLSNMPQLLLNQKSGHPALLYTHGSADLLEGNLASSITSATFVAVGATPASITSNNFIVDVGPNAGDNEGIQTTTTPSCQAVKNNGTGYTTSVACVASTWYRWVTTVTNTLVRIYQTGVQGADSTSSTTGITASAEITVGAAINSGTYTWGGSLSELIVFAPNVADSDSLGVSANQSAYWGI